MQKVKFNLEKIVVESIQTACNKAYSTETNDPLFDMYFRETMENIVIKLAAKRVKYTKPKQKQIISFPLHELICIRKAANILDEIRPYSVESILIRDQLLSMKKG